MSPTSDAGARPLLDVTRYAALADAVRRCELSGTPLWVRGGGTLLQSPSDDVAMLEIRPYDRLVAHARDDMTVTVEAGMTVAALQLLLAAAGQQLPLDVPFAERTTVGGLIATNLSGPRRFSRGGARDSLLGIRVVGRGGDVFRGGGRVVKNVAGYDLCKLYTGSCGWVGAIVEATFRVVAAPEAGAAVVISITDPASAESQVSALLRGALRPASIDLINNIAAARLGLGAASLALVVGFEGSSNEVDAQLATLQSEANSAVASFSLLDSAAYGEFCRAAVEVALSATAAVRFNVQSGRVGECGNGITTRCPAAPIVAHVADGVIWVGFEEQHAAELHETCVEIERLGGSWLVPRGPRSVQDVVPMMGPPRSDWTLMRRVKTALDPAGIFGRGSPFDLALRAQNPER